MVTKEHKLKRYCCFYVSEFHLEMILLPYIKNNINKTNFFICTEKSLFDSMKLLLERTNLNNGEKNKILGLNWENNSIKEIKGEKCTIIINGGSDYILNINKEIESLNLPNIHIIDCYDVNQNGLKIAEIHKKYDDILNTKSIVQ